MIILEDVEEARDKRKLDEFLLDEVKKSEANNIDLIDYIRKHNFFGPILVATNELVRTVGPEENMLNKEGEDVFHATVNQKINLLKSTELQPVIVCEKFNDKYFVLDGNHTLYAWTTMAQEKVWIVFTEDSVVGKLAL